MSFERGREVEPGVWERFEWKSTAFGGSYRAFVGWVTQDGTQFSTGLQNRQKAVDHHTEWLADQEAQQHRQDLLERVPDDIDTTGISDEALQLGADQQFSSDWQSTYLGSNLSDIANAQFPGTDPWEQLSGGSGNAVSGIMAGAESAKAQVKSAQMQSDAQLEAAQTQAKSAVDVAQINAQASMHNARLQAGVAGYGHQLGYAGTIGGAGLSAGASMYGADVSAGASMYGADRSLEASLGSAGVSAGASEYGAELSAGASMYATDEQAYQFDQAGVHAQRGSAARDYAAARDHYHKILVSRIMLPSMFSKGVTDAEQSRLAASLQRDLYSLNIDHRQMDYILKQLDMRAKQFEVQYGQSGRYGLDVKRTWWDIVRDVFLGAMSMYGAARFRGLGGAGRFQNNMNKKRTDIYKLLDRLKKGS